MNETQTTPNTYDALAQQATDRVDAVIEGARKAADGALDTLQDKASHLATVAPGALGRAAAQVDELAHRGVERARAATDTAREQARHAGDRTVAYIQHEPVKAVLIATAAGAGLAALISLLTRRGSGGRGGDATAARG